MSLKDEIKQGKPFSSTAQEAILNIIKTADKLDNIITEFLKDYNLTSAQYNVLRILKGSGKNGWNCSEISSRMIKKDSDITRLLDRLEKPGFLKRVPDANDRRSIRCHITTKGIKLVDKITPFLKQNHDKFQNKIGSKKLKELIHILEQIRIISKN